MTARKSEISQDKPRDLPPIWQNQKLMKIYGKKFRYLITFVGVDIHEIDFFFYLTIFLGLQCYPKFKRVEIHSFQRQKIYWF